MYEMGGRGGVVRHAVVGFGDVESCPELDVDGVDESPTYVRFAGLKESLHLVRAPCENFIVLVHVIRNFASCVDCRENKLELIPGKFGRFTHTRMREFHS